MFGIVLTPALQALDAITGTVLLIDDGGERLRVAALHGDPRDTPSLWQDGDLQGPEPLPASDALRRHEALFFEHAGDLVRAYPDLEARTGGVAAVATAVLPLFLDDRPLGVLILDFREPHRFTPEEIQFLRTLAAQSALALGRARLLADLQR